MIDIINNDDLRQGIFFGVNSGVITTTGVLAGISQTSITPIYLIITIMSLAISDSASEAMGLFVSKKAEDLNDRTNGPLLSMISLSTTKFVIVSSFLLPLLFTKSLKYYKNLMWPLMWGLLILSFLDYNLSNQRNENFLTFYIPHVLVLVFVVFCSKYFGKVINSL